MSPRRLARRKLLKSGLGTLGALLVASCAAPAPTPTAPAAPAKAEPTAAPKPTGAATQPTASAKTGATTPATPASFKEAPSLATEVAAGKLPPVEQRLPKEPMVIQPIERVGDYGGQWRTGILGTSDTAWFSRTIGYESLVRWDHEWKNLVPDIAKKYEVSPDGKVFTFYLREGMKWSDGEPFTADDFVFWYEDVVSDDLISPAKPAWFATAGKLGKIEKVDQFTFKMVFEHPNGTLLKRLAMNGGGEWIMQAKYAKQFHIKYNKDAVEKMVADQKLPDWAALFNKMTGSTQGIGNAKWYNADVPTLFPWMVTNPLGRGTRVVAQRNPYYWKVDTDGNQLPYLDEIVYDVVEKADTLVLKALNGEIDMMDRHIATLQNKAVFSDGMATGDYRFFTTIPDSMNVFIVLFNFNHKDPVLREIIHNLKFRVGLSHAINRQEILDVVFFGQGEPWQAAPLKQSPYYHEQLATQYLEYDVDKANQSLDEAGLTQKSPDGIRLRPDGKPLVLTFETLSTNQAWIDTLGLIKNYWQAVGVEINLKSEDRSLRQQRVTAAEHDVTNWGGDGGIDAILGPYWYLPFASFNSHATQWARWYETNGREGEEPSEPAKKQYQIYDEVKVTVDDAKQRDLMKQLLDISAEQFWIMGIGTSAEGYGIVKNNFRNVPETMFSSGQEISNPGATMPEQYFIEK